jgi:hypothetical protein
MPIIEDAPPADPMWPIQDEPPAPPIFNTPQYPPPAPPMGNEFISRTDPTTIGSEQYNRELAKAQEPISDRAYPGVGGDVNWEDVSRIVNLHLHAAAQQAKAKEEAIRFAGQKEYQQLIDGGATPQEALRRTAGKLYFQNPEAMVRAMQLAEVKKNLPLETQTINGQTFYRTGPSGFAHVPTPNPNSRNAMPLDAQANLKNADVNVAVAQRDLNEAKKAAVPIFEHGDKDAQQKAQDAIVAARFNLIKAQQTRTDLSTNWQSAASAPAGTNAPAATSKATEPAKAAPAEQKKKPVKEIERYTKDGKKAIFDAETKAFIRFED